MLTPETIGSGGLAVACLGTLIWVVRFTLTRVESAIRENTHVTRELLMYFKRHGMYESGGKDAA